jgi:3beta-hydroxy-delta5-steroid dehydrogenase/steroid delta-isomerase
MTPLDLRVDGAPLTPEQVGPVCLVTGGSGYLGRHLVQMLQQIGCTVRVLDMSPFPGRGVKMFRGDLRDASLLAGACEGVDTVFHAASVLTLLGVARPEVRKRVWSINVDATATLLDIAKRQGVTRFVYTSSANVVIDRELLEADESSSYATEWVDVYGESKAAAEREVLAANVPDFHTLALRPGGIWGPGEGGLMIKTFLEQVASGAFVATIGDGSAVVDNTHVLNLVQAQLLGAKALADKPEIVGGRPYFITDDERINGVTWFRPILDGLGEPWPTRQLPGRLMYGLAWALEWAHYFGAPEPPVTRIGVLKLIRSSAFRIDNATRDLGYVPGYGQADLDLYLDDYRVMVEGMRRGTKALPGA